MRIICACTSQNSLDHPQSSLTVTAVPQHGIAAPQRKKRTKVTDTRLSPRVARALLQDGFYHRSRSSLELISRKQHRLQQQLPPQPQPATTDLTVLTAFCYAIYCLYSVHVLHSWRRHRFHQARFYVGAGGQLPSQTSALPSPRIFQHIGAKRSFLWPLKYAKMCFRSALSPGPRRRSSRRPHRP